MKTSDFLTPGELYTREELRTKFGIVDGNIFTGVFRPKGHDSIWLFVTEHKTPDMPQYQDLLDGNILYWDGQKSGRTDDWIINHKELGLELVVFYRKRRYEHPGAAFRYEGVFEYVSHYGTNPTHFVLQRVLDIEALAEEDIRAYQAEELIETGSSEKRYVNYYERNPKVRAAAIRIHGTRCMACGFDFESMYGERGKGYIEVHHIVPVSQLDSEILVDPEKDVVVLCANCHRMVHRSKDNVLSLVELKRIIQKNANTG